MARCTETERNESLIWLREHVPSGTRVYTILRHVSRSGMQREIGLVVFRPEDAYARHPNFHAARVLGERLGKASGVIVHGCGMDMGFDLVYRLGRSVHGDPRSLTHEWL
jgi:hypothetical protein